MTSLLLYPGLGPAVYTGGVKVIFYVFIKDVAQKITLLYITYIIRFNSTAYDTWDHILLIVRLI